MSDFLKVLSRAERPGNDKGAAPAPPGQSEDVERYRRLARHDSWRFAFATGIECSNPVITGKEGLSVRRDQLAECYHYTRFKEDLYLTRELGLDVLRYGLPYHLVNPARGRYDWGFADEAMGEILRLGITPILDLLHFGVPDWLGDFQNPELPVCFAEYAGRVAERYPWVRAYTPVNEIYVAARASGKDGVWNERLKTDRGFVTALKHLVAANIEATKTIARYCGNLIVVQSESAEYVHHISPHPSHEVKLSNKLRFLALDLLYRKVSDADVMLYLLDNGFTREEFNWFMRNDAAGYQIMGNDYYGRNEHLLLPDGSIMQGEDVLGWYLITKRYHERYYRPVMHTETNVFDSKLAPNWLWKQWANVLRMRRDGIPVLGFTWYSLIDQVDWDTSLAEQNNRVNECGLYDLDRRPRPVAAAYRQLLEAFKNEMTILPHGKMFEFTQRDLAGNTEV
ncbi:MAG: family 1 glycosylhydrolase [Bryobacteraceae bacterium]|nr:family 1 glycosylhydrolase [Bryobacteraceae bacterium]